MENLSWEITREEKKERTKKVIFRIWLPLIILGIIAATIGYPALFSYNIFARGWIYIVKQAFYTLIGIGISLLLLLVINKFALYKDRTYFLDDKGLTISKGKRKKIYLWADFEYFYSYSERYASKVSQSFQLHPQDSIGGPEREKIFGAEREIVGEIFYLKCRPRNIFAKLYKTFVVIYSEPNNLKVVNKFLSDHLQKKQMGAASDLGLIFYEFK